MLFYLISTPFLQYNSFKNFSDLDLPVGNNFDEKHSFLDNHSELEPFDQRNESLQISGVNNVPRIPTMDLFQIPELMPKAAPEIIYQSGKKFNLVMPKILNDRLLAYSI